MSTAAQETGPAPGELDGCHADAPLAALAILVALALVLRWAWTARRDGGAK